MGIKKINLERRKCEGNSSYTIVRLHVRNHATPQTVDTKEKTQNTGESNRAPESSALEASSSIRHNQLPHCFAVENSLALPMTRPTASAPRPLLVAEVSAMRAAQQRVSVPALGRLPTTMTN
jgi:hypothetical protein